jgi:hypothetical protein
MGCAEFSASVVIPARPGEVSFFGGKMPFPSGVMMALGMMSALGGAAPWEASGGEIRFVLPPDEPWRRECKICGAAPGQRCSRLSAKALKKGREFHKQR